MAKLIMCGDTGGVLGLSEPLINITICLILEEGLSALKETLSMGGYLYALISDKFCMHRINLRQVST